MKKSFLYLTVVFAFFFIGISSMNAQTERKDLKASKVESTRGNKYERPTTDNPVPAPSNSRGSAAYSCCIDFDNWTGYYIDVWVDETYRGRLSAWDNSTICVQEGWTTVYAETVGGTYYWSDEGMCSGFYTLKIE